MGSGRRGASQTSAPKKKLNSVALVRKRTIPTDQVASQVSSRGWVDPVPDPLLLRKSGRAGNEPGTSGPVARNSDH
jgi:hypothetical protein